MSEDVSVMLERLANLPTLADWRRIAFEYYTMRTRETPLPGDLDAWWREETAASVMVMNVGAMVDLCIPGAYLTMVGMVMVCARSVELSETASTYLADLERWAANPEAEDWAFWFHGADVGDWESLMIARVHEAVLTGPAKKTDELAKQAVYAVCNIPARGLAHSDLWERQMQTMADLLRQAYPTAPRRRQNVGEPTP